MGAASEIQSLGRPFDVPVVGRAVNMPAPFPGAAEYVVVPADSRQAYKLIEKPVRDGEGENLVDAAHVDAHGLLYVVEFEPQHITYPQSRIKPQGEQKAASVGQSVVNLGGLCFCDGLYAVYMRHSPFFRLWALSFDVVLAL